MRADGALQKTEEDKAAPVTLSSPAFLLRFVCRFSQSCDDRYSPRYPVHRVTYFKATSVDSAMTVPACSAPLGYP
jgi:hypothetical protein